MTCSMRQLCSWSLFLLVKPCEALCYEKCCITKVHYYYYYYEVVLWKNTKRFDLLRFRGFRNCLMVCRALV